MPTLREGAMERALPKITEIFKAAPDQSPKWRSLFDVVGTREAKTDQRGIYIVSSMWTPVRIPTVTRSTVTEFAPNLRFPMRVRTTIRLTADQLDAIDETAVTNIVTTWAADAMRAANATLLTRLSPFRGAGCRCSPPNDIVEAIDAARRFIGSCDALDLLVDADRWARLQGDDDLVKQIKKASGGGGIIAADGISSKISYVVPHQSGGLEVHTIEEPAVYWEFAGNDAVDVIASEEFVVAETRPLPRYTVLLE
jgi:hypothetical protein